MSLAVMIQTISYLQQWLNTNKGYSKEVFDLYSPVAANTLIVDSTQAIPLAEITVVNDSSVETQELIAATIPLGKGKITFVSTPIVFTNVGVLDPHTNVYLHRLMAQISDKPIIVSTEPWQLERQQSLLFLVILRESLVLKLLSHC